ncbi:hypothetical protein [Arcticibacter sp.]|uniref:hypothetical protein n=1 Tax=Arcticibacter sp. TaxID=1872630 RepID=UPI00388DFBEF
MKKQLLTLIAITFTTVAIAQKTDTVLFKGVKQIIVKNSLSSSENYKLAGQMMIDQGFSIGSKDPEFNQISTEPIKVNGNGSVYIMSIYVTTKDNEVKITGKTKSLSTLKLVSWQESKDAFESVTYKKSNVLSQNAYDKLVPFAKSLKPSSILYSE